MNTKNFATRSRGWSDPLFPTLAPREGGERRFRLRKALQEDYLSQLDDDAETARNHRDAIIRHRRSMLDLNTALGIRLLP